MHKNLLALSTALSILAFAPALAQDQPTVDCTLPANASDPACANQNNAAQPQTGTEMNAQDAQSGSGTNENQNAEGTTTTVPAGQNAQTTTSGTTTQQMSGSTLIVPADRLAGVQLMSANDFIGKTVYDQTGANIGEVNDMIVSGDGNVEAVILGVGGFLGIGEKDVAVNTDAIQMVQDGNTVRLVVQATKEVLEQAPTYDRDNRRYADQMNTDTTTTTTETMGTTGTAPDATGTTTAPATTPDATTGNSGATGGAVDCTLPANASDPACANQQQNQQ